ncbi:Uncharacterised protein [Serratia quinivorans]|jgi:hypothetical protein|nr:Uncharacterised protein [Serratia quinivorans]
MYVTNWRRFPAPKEKGGQSRLKLLTMFFTIKSPELRADINKELCLLIYPKHPKTTFFGCLSSD